MKKLELIKEVTSNFPTLYTEGEVLKDINGKPYEVKIIGSLKTDSLTSTSLSLYKNNYESFKSILYILDHHYYKFYI